MRIRCPHCQSPVEIVPDGPASSVTCPSCGSGMGDVEETLVQIKPDTRTIGRFELIACVGRGYFGEVWKARDLDLRQIVAVKIPRMQDLSEDYQERFLREARATAQLRHENIVRVLEVIRDAGRLFIVSDFVDGMTLGERMLNQRLNVRESAQLCATLARALHHAHEAGIVHRDLKPNNVMLDKANKPYLVDFGLAKQDSGEFSMTATGDILGTPAYMSPEQACGDSQNADRRSDVYSLGVVLYELLTGERPFKGSIHLLLKAIQQIEPSAPSKINPLLPKDLETICLKAMSKEPDKRYATALEMAEDLDRFLNGEPIRARRTSAVERSWRWMRRNPRLAAACAVTGLAMSVMAGMLIAKPNPISSPETTPRTVRLETIPPGARIIYYPLSKTNGEPLFDQAIEADKTGSKGVRLKPGDYFVVAVSNTTGYSFHEVYRRIPAGSGSSGGRNFESWEIARDGSVILPKVVIPRDSVTNGMASFAGAVNFEIGDQSHPELPPHQITVAPFWMDGTEVTVGDVKRGYRANGIQSDPPAFQAMLDKPLADNRPVTFVAQNDAMSIAEHLGKRLPTEFEYEFAATMGGSQRFPWGDDPTEIREWTIGDVDSTMTWDRTPTRPPVRGLYSNVCEWTTSWQRPYPSDPVASMFPDATRSDRVIVRGGGPSVFVGETQPADWAKGPRQRFAEHRMTAKPTLGFRCVRSAKPTLPGIQG